MKFRRILSTLALLAVFGAHHEVRAQVQTQADVDLDGATVDGTKNVGEYSVNFTGVGAGFGGVLGGETIAWESDVYGNLVVQKTNLVSTTCTDIFVLYLDTVAGGFADTSTFTDRTDVHRAAISGFQQTGGNARANLVFAADFRPDYAIAFGNGYAGLWKLVANGSHTHIVDLTTPQGNCFHELGGFTIEDVGLQPGEPMKFVATLINPLTAVRSNEFHGLATAPANNIGAAAFTMPAGSYHQWTNAAVLINEIDADSLDADDDEFVELKTGPGVNMNGLLLVSFDGADDLSFGGYVWALTGNADSNGYYVAGSAGLTPDLVTPDNTLPNGPDAIALYLDSAVNWPNDTPITTTNLIDAVVYDSGDPLAAGLIAGLTPGQPQVSEAANGAKQLQSNQRCSGWNLTTDSFIQASPTPGADNACTACTMNTDCAACQQCDTTIGFCVAAPGTTACDDGDACTTGETCAAGVCGGGTTLDCTNLDDACNVGACNSTTGMCEAQPTNEGATCDDGDICTETDVCAAGTCGGTVKDCTAFDDACNVGTCNATTGACEATPANPGAACDDGDLCTTGETCAAGVCGGASPVDCSAQDSACAVGVCNAATGACEAQAANEGGMCDDGNGCTTGDVCTAGVCGGMARDCSAFTDACNTGACNAATGMCEATPANEGGACDDGDLCTQTDRCSAGVCGGTATDCSTFDTACTAGVCNGATGMCESTPANEGGACDDTDPCTNTDVCTAGTCAGTALDCSNLDGPCQTGMCNAGTGTCEAVPAADGSACDDSNLCTENDTCAAGVCAGNPAETGTACGDDCNAGVCDGATGQCMQEPLPDGTMCDDGDECTDGDSCVAGICQSGADVCEDMGVADMGGGEDMGTGADMGAGDDTGGSGGGGGGKGSTADDGGCCATAADASSRDTTALLAFLLLGVAAIRRRR